MLKGSVKLVAVLLQNRLVYRFGRSNFFAFESSISVGGEFVPFVSADAA